MNVTFFLQYNSSRFLAVLVKKRKHHFENKKADKKHKINPCGS